MNGYFVQLQRMIDQHDLTYACSDDGSCYRRGQAQYAEIVHFARQLGDLDKAANMWLEKCRRVLSKLDDQQRYQRGFLNDLTSPNWR